MNRTLRQTFFLLSSPRGLCQLAGRYFRSIFFSVLMIGTFALLTTVQPCEAADIPVSGTISSDTTWTTGNTCILTGAVTISAGITLTVQSDVVVKFNIGNNVVVNGTLDIQGTSGTPVYLTDSRDDTVGGDTNGDADATLPAAGGWGGILVADGGSAHFVHTEMRYAGELKFNYRGAFNFAAILKYGNAGTFTADNLTLVNSSKNGLFMYDSTAAHSISDSHFDAIGRNGFYLDNVSNITIENSTIQNCTWNGIHMLNSDGSLTGTTIRNNATYGIKTVGAVTNPIIIKSIIKSNLIGIESSDSAEPLIGGSVANGNDIYGNTNYGVFNGDSGVTIHAEYNYWGQASGPYHPTSNPSGGGDTVSDYVSYGNYAALPVNEILNRPGYSGDSFV